MRWGAPPPRGGGWGGGGGYNILGVYFPKAVAWLIGATLFMSAVGAALQRNNILPVWEYLVLNARYTLRGELWRLFPWVLFEYGFNGLNLIFGCAFLYIIGRDLAPVWGTRRFLAYYFGMAAASGVLTCLVGLVWPLVARYDYMTMWPVLDALIIAWAVRHPSATIMIWFVLPISGRHLIVATCGMTFIWAVMGGFHHYIPHFAAELAALVYMDVFSFRRTYLRARMAMLQRDYKRRTSGLRAVDRDKGEEPPRWTH
jgi:membrane associated rhomboid family serine protease